MLLRLWLIKGWHDFLKLLDSPGSKPGLFLLD